MVMMYKLLSVINDDNHNIRYNQRYNFNSAMEFKDKCNFN